MTTEQQLMDLLERANPVRDPDALDVRADPDRYLATPREDSPMITFERTDEKIPASRRRWIAPALAAAAITAVVVAGLIVAVGDDDDPAPADQPSSTTTPATSTTAEPQAVLDPVASSVADAYFAAGNDGDTEALLALIDADAVITENFHHFKNGLPRPDLQPASLVEFETKERWRHGQGTVFDEVDCRPLEQDTIGEIFPAMGWEPPPGTIGVDCSFETRDALILAVEGTRPVSSRAFMVVDDGAITELHLGYGPPDFLVLGDPFEAWLAREHPEVVAASTCCGTPETAYETGQVRAEWAQQWASYLQESGCDPESLCLPEQPDGTAATGG